MNNGISIDHTRKRFPHLKLTVAQGLMFLALGAASNLTLAETARFSFEAVLEKIVAPKGEKLSLAPTVGTQAKGTVEIVLSSPSSAPLSPHIFPNGSLIWLNALKSLQLFGVFNAKFENGSVFTDGTKIDIANTPYNIGISACWGPNSGCTASGSELVSIDSESKSRRLTPKIFRYSHDDAPSEKTLASIIRLIESAASKDKTYLIITSSSSEDSTEILTDAGRQMRMLWRIIRSSPSQ